MKTDNEGGRIVDNNSGDHDGFLSDGDLGRSRLFNTFSQWDVPPYARTDTPEHKALMDAINKRDKPAI
jgi:hypothetical protein